MPLFTASLLVITPPFLFIIFKKVSYIISISPLHFYHILSYCGKSVNIFLAIHTYFIHLKEEDDYSGLKYNVLATFDNLRVNLSIDIATGDIITPSEIEYDYKMMFEDRSLKIMTYNIESIIAEKFQTVIARGILNSRMKDYYDLYYLITHKNFSKENLRMAISRTFLKRQTSSENIDEKILDIENSEFVKELWIKYSNKYTYANNIEFITVVETLKSISKII